MESKNAMAPLPLIAVRDAAANIDANTTTDKMKRVICSASIWFPFLVLMFRYKLPELIRQQDFSKILRIGLE